MSTIQDLRNRRMFFHSVGRCECRACAIPAFVANHGQAFFARAVMATKELRKHRRILHISEAGVSKSWVADLAGKGE